MTVDTFRQIVKRQPFEAFTIHMSDGRALRVTHPDFVLLPPNWRSSEVVVARPDGGWDFVYLRNVTSVESQGMPPATGNRGSGESGNENAA